MFQKKDLGTQKRAQGWGGMLEKYRAQVVFLESLCNMGGSGSCFGNELYKCLCKVEKRVYWEAVGVAVGNTGVLVACREHCHAGREKFVPGLGHSGSGSEI